MGKGLDKMRIIQENLHVFAKYCLTFCVGNGMIRMHGECRNIQKPFGRLCEMDKTKIKKVVLAYSGGLDTSIIIPWLKENYNNCEVIAVSGNVGQSDELEGLEEKAIKTGASKCYVEDLTDEFVDEYIIPTVKAGAKYEEYMLGTSFARPIIAKRIVEIAKAEGADAICHGCTGKGNDQVRFELAIKAFAPDMPVIAPWREWDIKSRDEEITYAEAHNVPLRITRETNYSKDKNLWHLSHEGLDLEDPGNEPQYEKEGFLEMGVSPMQAPDEPTYITLEFDKGVPVSLDGEKMSAKEIILKLNAIGGANGIGLLDIVENRLVGMKCRGVYETPGGAILYKALSVLESICLDKYAAHKKQELSVCFAELVYNGQWYTPLRRALSAFVDELMKNVTGRVRLKLYKGNMINAGVWSEYSLYDPEIATFDEDEVYNQADAAGFITLFGLPIKVQAKVDQKNKR
jgi:argininosuccinate synthase